MALFSQICDVNAYLEFKRAEEKDAMHDELQTYFAEKDDPYTIAAHHGSEDWTEEESEEIEHFEEFLKLKRKQLE